jgi:copper chaperone NosL
MTYQPPLLGSKQLLNMTTTSLPAGGGYLAGISMLLSFFAVYYDFKIQRRDSPK